MSEPGAIPDTSERGKREHGGNRRDFLRSTMALGGRAALGGAVLAGYVALRRGKTAPAGTRTGFGILRPPGSLDEEAFLGACIRCTRCADACEAQCIQLFGPEGGDHQGTPYIESRDRGCTLCLACGEACPTGAIATLERMQEARMGIAEIDARLCLSLNGTGICGACFTVCPLRGRAITQAIRNAPVVHADACVGCGLCEEICLVREPRAIRVRTTRGVTAGDRGGAA
jgi:MauM/NapG family ferredoxin protein